MPSSKYEKPDISNPNANRGRKKKKKKRIKKSSWPPTMPTAYWLSKEKKITPDEAKEKLDSIREFEEKHDEKIANYLRRNPEPIENKRGIPADKFKIRWRRKNCRKDGP